MMEKRLLIHLSCFVCLWELVRARLDLTVDSNACNNYYDMENIHEAYVTYKGAHLGTEECYIKFTNWDAFQKKTCVKPSTLKLDCSTKVEYFRHFISEYLEPKRRFTCGTESVDEWCSTVRTTHLFIVFRTSRRSFGDNVRLHVYLRDLPKENSSATESSTATIIIPVIVTMIMIIMLVVILVACVIAKRRRSLRETTFRTPYVYQTTTGQLNSQTGTAPMQPQYQPQYQPPQQQTGQGNYQWHPMQSAYPVTAQQSSSPLLPNDPNQPSAPSAPTLNDAAPPPSYESVTS